MTLQSFLSFAAVPTPSLLLPPPSHPRRTVASRLSSRGNHRAFIKLYAEFAAGTSMPTSCGAVCLFRLSFANVSKQVPGRVYVFDVFFFNFTLADVIDRARPFPHSSLVSSGR